MTLMHGARWGDVRAGARRIAVLCVHTSPLASPGGRESGGMNVYVRELSQAMGTRGYVVDVFTRRSSPEQPETQPFGPNCRVINIDAGPAGPIDKEALAGHLEEFEAGVLAFVEARGRLRTTWCTATTGSRAWSANGWRRAGSVPHVAMFHTLGEVKNRARRTEHEPACASMRSGDRDGATASWWRPRTRRTC